jgi:hypothetical protein
MEIGASSRSPLAMDAARSRPRCSIPRESNGTACVAVSSSGRASFLDPSTPQGAVVQDALTRGVTVLLPEVLLGGAEARGEPTALPTDAARHALYAGYTLAYNRCLLSERARDVLIAIEHAHAVGVDPRGRAVGRRSSGHASAARRCARPGRVSRVLADAEWDFDAIESLADPDLLPGALRFGGLGAFAGLCAPTELTLASRSEPLFCDEGLLRRRGSPGSTPRQAAVERRASRVAVGTALRPAEPWSFPRRAEPPLY